LRRGDSLQKSASKIKDFDLTKEMNSFQKNQGQEVTVSETRNKETKSLALSAKELLLIRP